MEEQPRNYCICSSGSLPVFDHKFSIAWDDNGTNKHDKLCYSLIGIAKRGQGPSATEKNSTEGLNPPNTISHLHPIPEKLYAYLWVYLRNENPGYALDLPFMGGELAPSLLGG